MTTCLENIQIPPCMWFESGEKRNTLVSMLAGTLVRNFTYLSLGKEFNFLVKSYDFLNLIIPKFYVRKYKNLFTTYELDIFFNKVS